MEIKMMNQYTQTWNVDEHEVTTVYRTQETLQQLQERLNLSGSVYDGKWSYDGVISVAYGILADSNNDINRVQEFNKKKHHVDFGNKGYHTLEEIKQSDLVWIKGYGIVDESNIKEFENKFKEAAQKK